MMKKYILLCLFIAASFVAKAQSHISTGKYACDLVPSSRGTEKYTCPACTKIREAKRLAKLAADKKEKGLAAEKAKTDKTANAAAGKKQQQEIAKKNKVTELGLKMPATGAARTSAKENASTKTTAVKEKEVYMGEMSYGKGFINAKTEENIIFYENDSPYQATKGAFLNDCGAIQWAFPANLGIATLKTTVRTAAPLADELGSYQYAVWDLIDVKQKRTFNSDRISFIGHVYGDWFMVGYDGFKNDQLFPQAGELRLYNVKTKEYVDVPEKSFSNAVTLSVRASRPELVNRNYKYMNGNYHPETTACYHNRELTGPEAFMKDKLGGTEKWKACIVVRQIKVPRGDVNHIVYYVDANDKIAKLEITRVESGKF
jgi:hypothetical protein